MTFRDFDQVKSFVSSAMGPPRGSVRALPRPGTLAQGADTPAFRTSIGPDPIGLNLPKLRWSDRGWRAAWRLAFRASGSQGRPAPTTRTASLTSCDVGAAGGSPAVQRAAAQT